ncbi:MAG: ABC transporter permease [Lachnospiraceae bacterium]|nr:ABC transporter permease [Lachnospiraceae bacterium]
MLKYCLQRIFYMILVFCVIMLMCFVLIRMLPLPVLPPDDPHTEVVEMRREAMGYSEPYLVQFGLFARNVLTHFDWGVSDKLYFGQEVWDIFKEKLPATVIVNLYSILFSIPIGIILGIVAALKKNTWVDYVISTLTMAVISVPSFVYGFLIQYFLCYRLQLFPFVMESGTDYFSPEMIRSMIPPVLALSFGVIAGFTRTTRAELTEVLGSDYMLLAKIKGLTAWQAMLRHGLRNCFVVIIPQIFGEFLGILSGSLIIEKIFAIPGVGALTLNAINGPDYNLFMLSTAFYTAIGLSAGLVVDLSYGFLDPRIRMGAKE